MKSFVCFLLLLLGQHTYAHEARIECSFRLPQKSLTVALFTGENTAISGTWTHKDELRAQEKRPLDKMLSNHKDFFYVRSSRNEILRLCYEKAADESNRDSLYFAVLTGIRAFRGDDPKCHGHALAVLDEAGAIVEVGRDSAPYLRQRLRNYNFNVVLADLVYRSGQLGSRGIKKVSQVLATKNLPPLRSIASIHVMGFGGPGGSYNLEEIAETKRRGLTFLHSYSYDPKLMVYMDGTDPSAIASDDPHHGNIMNSTTVDKFVPIATVREQLKIDRSLAEGRVLNGDTADFLQSLENIIAAPWPILIHCKGGRHKTGMFSIILEYLAFQIAMSPEVEQEVTIPSYKNRIARWWGQQGSFQDIFTGGPFYESLRLRPAEVHYVQHNSSVFRQRNIDFVRRLVNGDALTTPQLQEQWQRIKKAFHQKLIAHAYPLTT